MEEKTERILKVYNQSQGNSWNIPTIMLKGEWLRKFGFDCGDKIIVILEDDIIVIKKLR